MIIWALSTLIFHSILRKTCQGLWGSKCGCFHRRAQLLGYQLCLAIALRAGTAWARTEGYFRVILGGTVKKFLLCVQLWVRPCSSCPAHAEQWSWDSSKENEPRQCRIILKGFNPAASPCTRERPCWHAALSITHFCCSLPFLKCRMPLLEKAGLGRQVPWAVPLLETLTWVTAQLWGAGHGFDS